MSDKSFNNLLKNKYSKDDYLEVLRQFKSENEFSELNGLLEESWYEASGDLLSEERYQSLKLKALEEIKSRKIGDDKFLLKRFVKLANKIAAFLVIPLLLISTYLFFQWRDLSTCDSVFAEIHCPLGTRTKFNLPDGTTGWLNSGSTLKYPVQFNGTRKVELNGEAYFRVIKMGKVPFVVNANDFGIKVLGTEFNVKAFPDDNLFSITLEEGKVEVSANDSPNKFTIKPGFRFSFDKEQCDARLVKVDTRYFTSWKDGVLMFRNTPFSEVLKSLERWYNVEFICNDSKLLGRPYRATFHEERLEHVLNLLTLTEPIEYKIIDSKILADGTYEKQKIYVKMK